MAIPKLGFMLPLGLTFLFFFIVSTIISLNKKEEFLAKLTPLIMLFNIAIFVGLCLCFYKYTVDDAYISLRYARNLAKGFGIVFNTDGSHPIEGYTNFLWVIVEAPLFLCSLTDNLILHSVKIIGISFGIGIVILVYFLVNAVSKNRRASLLASTLIAMVPYLSFWAVGGLETTMYIFWLTAGLYCYLVEDKESKFHFRSSILFVLAALTRPEGLFFVFTLYGWEVLSLIMPKLSSPLAQKRFAIILPGVVTFFVIYGYYFWWRYRFYGLLLPNTFYAKSGTLGLKAILKRALEMSSFLIYLVPFGGFIWLKYFEVLKNRQRELLTVACGTLIALSFAAKREWMPGFRYELPFVPIVFTFSSLSLVQLLFRGKEDISKDGKSLITNLGFLVLLGIYLLYPSFQLRGLTHYTDELDRAHVALGKWLGQYSPKDASYASWDMGAVPYFSNLPTVTELNLEGRGLLSDHINQRKYGVEDFLAYQPSFIVLPVPPNSKRTDGMFGFYINETFRKNYEHIFSLAFRKDYVLAVHKRHDISLSQNATTQAKHLSETSFSESNSDAEFGRVV